MLNKTKKISHQNELWYSITKSVYSDHKSYLIQLVSLACATTDWKKKMKWIIILHIWRIRYASIYKNKKKQSLNGIVCGQRLKERNKERKKNNNWFLT